MSMLRTACALLLLGLSQAGCTDRPQFTLKITDLDGSVDKLYVNAGLEYPVDSNANSKELVFDLAGQIVSGSFDFGLILDSTTKASDGRVRGFADLALVGGGCIKQIRRVRLDGPTGIGTPTAVSLSFTADPSKDDSVVPLDPRTACYEIKRPLITSIQRELVGTYGSPRSRLVLLGWGFYKQTTAKAQLAFDNALCAAPCALWNEVALPFDDSSSFSTTRMAFDASPLNAQFAPLFDRVASVIPTSFGPGLSALSGAKPKSMASALFPLTVTIRDAATGTSDTFSEAWK